MPARFDRRQGELVRTRVAVEDSAHPALPRLDHHRPGVILGVARVYHERKTRLRGQRYLRRESVTLLGPRRVVIMVVEPAFADRYGARGDVLANDREVPRSVETDCVMRVHARRVPDESWILARDVPRRASGAEDIPGAAAGADADDRFGPALTCALDYVDAVAVERRVCEVRVGVDEWRATDVCFGHFL